MVDRAAALTKKRNLEGTPIPNPRKNSFEILSDTGLMLRASKMGVVIPNSDFSTVDIIRELELSRAHAECANMQAPVVDLFVTNELGNRTPISDEWGDNNEVDEEFEE